MFRSVYRLALVVALGAALAWGADSLWFGQSALAADPPKAAEAAKAKEQLELAHPKETHFRNMRQLTFGGENAEAYFSPNGESLVFQSTRAPFSCDHIFTMALDGSNVQQISSGKGRTTCSYYYPDNASIIYASTHLGSPDCPPTPDMSQGYVWPLYESFDLFLRTPTGEVKQLTDAPGYDAEATVSPLGDRVLFTSVRDGDLDIYSMALDGSDVTRLTDALGYDGGPFFSADGKKIVYRAMHPEGEKAQADYKRLLKQNKVRPSKLEVWVMDADGKNKTQVTNLGAASFCPFFHPDGKRIVFSTNAHDPSKRNFEIYIINVDGSGLERLTYNDTFDGFPMFSPDGKTLVFCSNRNNAKRGETNVFVCEWVD